MIAEGKLFIDGEWVDPQGGETYEGINPATGEVNARIAQAREADVDKAVQAARRALEGPWGRLTGEERGRLLLKVGELVEKNGEALARLDVADMGKPIGDARGEWKESIRNFEYYAGMADKIEGTVHPVGGDYLNYTVREPVGVVGAITPWNYPTWMFSIKVAPPLACGCTVVLKPAEQSPRSALVMGALCQEAGIPEGVVNVISGDGPGAGAPLASHRGVDHVSFTGSSAVGKLVAQMAASHLAGVTCELGGKTPNIIFADAPWEEALNGAVMGIFVNSGQVCVAGSRLLVEEEMKDDFVGEVMARAKKLKVGDPLKEDTNLGPIVSKEQFERVKSYIEVGKKEGAKCLLGGAPPAEASLARGFFILPTVFDGVGNEMRIAQEEIFGPVLAAITFKDEEEVIAKANAITYGLQTCVWTRDLRRAHRLANRLEAGIICINCWGATAPSVPYSGFKDSGMGAESGLSAIEAYTRRKNVWVKLSEEFTPWP